MMMLKAEYKQRGPVPQDVIRAVPIELVQPAAGQALVALLAAPINPSDLLTLTGEYGMLPPLPAVGGSEGVGRIAALGSGTEGFKVGQLVLMPGSRGTWVTHVLCEARVLVPLPDGADPLQLAMLRINPPTAALLLSEFVTLAPGEWVIQNAANSGVGSYLMQLARHRGLRTVNLVRRESAVAGTAAQGGDVVLVDGNDIADRVKEATGGAAIRLAIDAVGGAATDRLARCLADGGTVVNYGVLSGEACRLAPQALIFRDISLRGFWLMKWFRSTSGADQRAMYADLTNLIAAGTLHAPVHATYPISRIQEAVAAAHSGGRDGKVLVTGE